MISDDVKFTQLGENLRFLGDMRFKQLTLSMGVLATSAAGLGQYGDRDLAPGMRASVAIVLFAMIYTAVSWVMEVRSTLHWIATRNEARDLWPQHHSSWGLGWISATNAVVVFYAIAYACLWRLVRISPKSITRFGPRRSPVSIQSDQPFRLMSITGSRARTRG